MNKNYYPSINMLRGLAAIMVCIFHFTTYSDHHGDLFSKTELTYKIGEYGVLGVFVFFIITGFVIPLTLIKYNFQLKQLPRFLAKRWIRIEIPYLGSIVLILLVAFAFSIKNHTTFDFNITQLFHHLVYSAAFFDYQWYNPIYWTLAIEMQFYLLIALIYPLLNFENQKLNCLLPLALGITALMITDNRLVFHYGAIFAQGILLLLILKNKLGKYLGILSIILCFAITMYVNGTGISFASILTVIVIAFFNIDKKIFNWLGKISYSLYLIHGLIGVNLLYFLGRYADGYYTKMLLVLVALILSIFITYFYWKFIEHPSQKWSKKITISNK